MIKNISSIVLICIISIFCTNSALVNNKSKEIVKGERPNRNIMQNVMNNVKSLREIYNERLKERPKLKGKIVVDFKVLGTGEIIDGIIIESTINDSIFEINAIKEINNWKFDEYQNKKDTTEKRYPFVFSP